MEKVLYFALAASLAIGLYQIYNVGVRHDRSYGGRRTMRKMAAWGKTRKGLWDAPAIKRLVSFFCRFVYLDDVLTESLFRQLDRVELNVTPQEFTARKYVIVFTCMLGAILCALLQFWLGIILAILLAIYGLMRQRDVLQDKIRKKDAEISDELPRFVRTICQQLRTNRDIPAALTSYRKVAGTELGRELDILLMHIRTGGIQPALQQFQTRLGSDPIYRLCGALTDIERGIDQTATLNYLADDMAQQARLSIQKRLSTRPGKMRMTYLPAVFVCVAMIIYVLVMFVINQLNNLM